MIDEAELEAARSRTGAKCGSSLNDGPLGFISILFASSCAARHPCRARKIAILDVTTEFWDFKMTFGRSSHVGKELIGAYDKKSSVFPVRRLSCRTPDSSLLQRFLCKSLYFLSFRSAQSILLLPCSFLHRNQAGSGHCLRDKRLQIGSIIKSTSCWYANCSADSAHNALDCGFLEKVTLGKSADAKRHLALAAETLPEALGENR